MIHSDARRSWAEIDAAALRHNLAVAQECAGLAELCAIVKADGYGHGIELVAPALAKGVHSFGVASLQEAVELDSLGLNRPIHILGPLLPGERAAAVAWGFQATVSSVGELEEFATLGHAKIWIKVDTGMGRAGCFVGEVDALVALAAELEQIELCGLSTHCPSADEEAEFTFAQLLRWESTAAQASCRRSSRSRQGCAQSGELLPRQIANSAALLGFRRPVDQLARPGLMLYGVSPLAEHAARLQAALHWRTRLALVRRVPPGTSVSYGRTWTAEEPAILGTITVGYADGYRRDYAPGEVLVRGQRCPIRGRVTMDQIVIELTALKGTPVEAGEIVTLLGRDGDEFIGADELARRAATIPWEVLTTISKRVERRAIQTNPSDPA